MSNRTVLVLTRVPGQFVPHSLEQQTVPPMNEWPTGVTKACTGLIPHSGAKPDCVPKQSVNGIQSAGHTNRVNSSARGHLCHDPHPCTSRREYDPVHYLSSIRSAISEVRAKQSRYLAISYLTQQSLSDTRGSISGVDVIIDGKGSEHNLTYRALNSEDRSMVQEPC